MKKQLFLAAALCGATLLAGTARAQEYNLRVGGTQVTAENAADVTGEGTVSFDAATQTLNLNNAVIQPLHGYAIESQIEGLTIALQGVNTADSEDAVALKFGGNTTIVGPGRLNAISYPSMAIYIPYRNLTIRDAHLALHGFTWGIAGEFGTSEVVTIVNSTVEVGEAQFSTVSAISDLVLSGCEITAPAGAYFDAQLRGITADAGASLTKLPVRIEPNGGGSTTTEYDLWVGGLRVDSDNAADILGDGSASFDPAAGELSLNNARIDVPEGYVVESAVAGLVIRLAGDNSMSSPTSTGIYATAGLAIEGPGSLAIDGGAAGIYVDGCPLTIRGGATVDANGQRYGICGNTGAVEAVTVDNATLRATGPVLGSIRDIHSLTLAGCHIAAPLGADFDADQKAVVLDGQIVTATIEIALGEAPATGIEGLDAAPLAVVGGRGTLVVRGAQGTALTVFNLAGQQVAHLPHAGDLATLALPQGAYVVVAGGRSAKALVR